MAEPYAIPITVGVVGHLDVITTEEQKLQISKLFRDLASEYPNSPVWLFSSIAEGADRLVARIFLDLKAEEKSLRDRFELIVPIPFSAEEYRKDFDEASGTEFDELVKQAKRHFCIRCEEFAGDRPSQYLRAGKFIADSSIILIALWDGEKGKKGGTADIVRHKIAGDDDNVADSTFEYDGSVFVVPSGRAGSDYESSGNKSANSPLSLNLVLQDEAIREVLEKIEEINSGSLMKIEAQLERSQFYLCRTPEKLDPPQKSLLRWYSVFDIHSLGFRTRDLAITVWLFVFGLFFIVALEIYTNLSYTNLSLAAAMMMIVFATLIYFYSKRTKNHRKYLLNRTVAEALRIQFYWSIAGINRNVSDYFLRIHRKDFTWVKHLLSAIYGITYTSRPITAEMIRDLTESWVKNQADFFRSSLSRMTRQMTFYNRISNISYFIAFALLFSIFFLGPFYRRHNLINDLMVIVGSLLGFFALIKAYIQMKGYGQLMNQYELMSVIYSRAESKIIETGSYDLTPEARRAYLKELFFVIGKEALIENGNWYQIFKEKEPEIEGI